MVVVGKASARPPRGRPLPQCWGWGLCAPISTSPAEGIDALGIEYDESRATVLQAYGHRVLRFRNEEVTSDLPADLARITAEVEVHDKC